MATVVPARARTSSSTAMGGSSMPSLSGSRGNGFSGSRSDTATPSPTAASSSTTTPSSPNRGIAWSSLRIALMPQGLTAHTMSPATSSIHTRSGVDVTSSGAPALTVATTSSSRVPDRQSKRTISVGARRITAAASPATAS